MPMPTDLQKLFIAMARYAPPSAADCVCCQGEVEGDADQVCEPCWQAITTGTRDDHPHPLSLAQQARRDESPDSRGLTWKGGDGA
jgi:hypothetical protein